MDDKETMLRYCCNNNIFYLNIYLKDHLCGYSPIYRMEYECKVSNIYIFRPIDLMQCF